MNAIEINADGYIMPAGELGKHLCATQLIPGYRNGPEGVRYTFMFANGYGATVLINGWLAYGPDEYEVHVLDAGQMTYETPVTGDVRRCQDLDELSECLDEIKQLTREQ